MTNQVKGTCQNCASDVFRFTKKVREISKVKQILNKVTMEKVVIEMMKSCCVYLCFKGRQKCIICWIKNDVLIKKVLWKLFKKWFNMYHVIEENLCIRYFVLWFNKRHLHKMLVTFDLYQIILYAFAIFSLTFWIGVRFVHLMAVIYG